MQLADFAGVCYEFTTKASGGNLAFHVGDDSKVVEQNHLSLAKRLGYANDALVHMQQIHSTDVHVVTEKDGFSTPPKCDALVTDKKDVPLMVMVADCTPVLFFDPTCKAIGVAHAGRAGAFGNIVKNVLDRMCHEYGSKPHDIIVAIGSAIGVCCYEVGKEIYEDSCNAFDYAFEMREGRYYLDINKILLLQLKGCGIKEENIQNDGVCTACHKTTYFSYRAEGKTGRFAGILMLRENF